MFRFFTIIDRSVEEMARWFLIIGVFLMLGISILGIVFRWFNITFMWIDPSVRHLVFACTFLGGVIATGRGTHIGIDIVGKLLENRNMLKARLWVSRFVGIIAVLTIAWLVYASLHFFAMEAKYRRVRFWGIHSSYLVGIIPVGFSLIAYRFLYRLIKSFVRVENKIV